MYGARPAVACAPARGRRPNHPVCSCHHAPREGRTNSVVRVMLIMYVGCTSDQTLEPQPRLMIAPAARQAAARLPNRARRAAGAHNIRRDDRMCAYGAPFAWRSTRVRVTAPAMFRIRCSMLRSLLLAFDRGRERSQQFRV